ncbi:MAG: hypothetical protein J1E39_09280 [Eubacterium sp.]|nr:hypothetical protein [Eubacterium sp.]
MKNDSLNHGKKNVGNRTSSCDLKNNTHSRRTEDISSSGLVFHKPFTDKLNKPEKK